MLRIKGAPVCLEGGRREEDEEMAAVRDCTRKEGKTRI